MEDTIKKEVAEIIEKQVAEKTAEKMAAIEKELNEAKEKASKLEKDIELQVEITKKLGEAKKEETKVNPIRKALEAKADELKALKGKGGKVIMKTVGEITRANVSSLAPFYSTDTEINMYPLRQPFLRNLINVGTATGAYHQWYEQAAGEGDAGMTDEGTPKSQRDQDWTLASAPVQKITAFTKVTEEALEDVPFMEDAINTDLLRKLALYEDAQILAGSGTGTPTQLKGILEYSTAFSVTNSVNAEFYQLIPNANKLDVLRTAIAIIGKSFGVANVICLHPSDVALLDMEKTPTGNYVLPPFTTADGTKFRGCMIVENTGITAGKFLVMDSAVVNYKVRKDATLAVGYDDDDFTNNRITIRAELRGVLYVKANDTGKIVDGTFATCIAMLNGTAPSLNVSITSPLNDDGDAVVMEEKTA